MNHELAAIRRQLARLAVGQHHPLKNLGEQLVEQLEASECPAEVIAELDEAVEQAGDRLPAEHRANFCGRFLARDCDFTAGIDWRHCHCLLLVGPTGVGKTTTIAKLAGDLVLRQQRRVALITIDTYRVGAADQLRTYADLLDIPCEVVSSPNQLSQAVDQFVDYDHILIDTAGRAPHDHARLGELRAMVKAVPGMQVMLTLSATCGRAEFAHIVERFSMLPIEHCTITKLDECAARGRLLACLRRHRLPVKYGCVGQEVPSDIQPADTACFTAGLIDDSKHASLPHLGHQISIHPLVSRRRRSNLKQLSSSASPAALNRRLIANRPMSDQAAALRANLPTVLISYPPSP